MSPREIEDFVKRWPALERRLHRALFAMRVPDSLRDDVVQESAIRLMGMWERLDPTLPLWPLLKTIAVRVVADEARKRRELPTDALPDAATDDAATTALARLMAADMWEAVARLTPKERDAVLAALSPAGFEGREPSATKMARLRGRRRMAAFLEEAGWGLAHAGALVRRPWIWASTRWSSGSADALLRDLVPAAIVALHVVAAGGLVADDVRSRPPIERVAVKASATSETAARAAEAARPGRRPHEAPARREAPASSPSAGEPLATETGRPQPHPGGKFESGAYASALGRGAAVEDREEGVHVLVCTGSDSSEPCSREREDAVYVWVPGP